MMISKTNHSRMMKILWRYDDNNDGTEDDDDDDNSDDNNNDSSFDQDDQVRLWLNKK